MLFLWEQSSIYIDVFTKCFRSACMYPFVYLHLGVFLWCCADPGMLALAPSRSSAWVDAICCWWFYWGLRTAYNWISSETVSVIPPRHQRMQILSLLTPFSSTQPNNPGLKLPDCHLLSKVGLIQEPYSFFSSTHPFTSSFYIVLVIISTYSTI